MDRRERERILREGGVRAPNTLERADAQRLAESLEGSPLVDGPLPQRLRNFRPGVDSYVASLSGPAAYMVRLREIDDATAAHQAALELAWAALAAECGDDEAMFARRWRAEAAQWDFYEVNDLIERHNRYYPAEARLPMDPRTGDFVLVGGSSYRRRPLDAAGVLEQFPTGRCAAA